MGWSSDDESEQNTKTQNIMKTVFTSNEIAHIWAHKSASYGKSPGNLSFRGDVIYSYSTAMARHIEHKGKTGIIYNDTRYSVTTAKSQRRIRMAIHGENVFHVSGQPYNCELRFTGDELFAYYVQEAAKANAASIAPRIRQTTRDGHKAQASAYLEQAKRVAEFYGLRKKVDEKAIERLAQSKARAEKRERAAQEERVKVERARQVLSYEAWKRNEHFEYGFHASIFPVAFRVEGDELVSTLGARVPLQAARVAYRFAMSKRGQAWRENGEVCEVGHYHLNAINEHGIVAGCHRIAWAELERLASVLA